MFVESMGRVANTSCIAGRPQELVGLICVISLQKFRELATLRCSWMVRTLWQILSLFHQKRVRIWPQQGLPIVSCAPCDKRIFGPIKNKELTFFKNLISRRCKATSPCARLGVRLPPRLAGCSVQYTRGVHGGIDNSPATIWHHDGIKDDQPL